MLPVNLSSGKKSFEEIRDFLKKQYRKDYTLSIFDTLEEVPMEVICDFDSMVDVIAYVSSIEHDFPNWIGVNELSDSYVVGLAFTKGHLNTSSVYEWKNNQLIKVF